MPPNAEFVTTDSAVLQLLPEIEEPQHGTHLQGSCNLTCPWDTSDSIPSWCCGD
jgi:hypothetical protein